MQLGIPDDIRQHADDRLAPIQPHLGRKGFDIANRVSVEPDPVPVPRLPAPQIGHDLSLPVVGPGHLLPGRSRLVHHRMVVRLVVTEDHAKAPVGGIPGDGADALLPGHRVDHTVRHINSVIGHNHVVSPLLHQAAYGRGSQKRGLQEAAKHKFPLRLGRKLADPVVAQRPSHRVLTNRKPLMHIVSKLMGREFGRDLPCGAPCFGG